MLEGKAEDADAGRDAQGDGSQMPHTTRQAADGRRLTRHRPFRRGGTGGEFMLSAAGEHAHVIYGVVTNTAGPSFQKSLKSLRRLGLEAAEPGERGDLGEQLIERLGGVLGLAPGDGDHLHFVADALLLDQLVLEGLILDADPKLFEVELCLRRFHCAVACKFFTMGKSSVAVNLESRARAVDRHLVRGRIGSLGDRQPLLFPVLLDRCLGFFGLLGPGIHLGLVPLEERGIPFKRGGEIVLDGDPHLEVRDIGHRFTPFLSVLPWWTIPAACSLSCGSRR